MISSCYFSLGLDVFLTSFLNFLFPVGGWFYNILSSVSASNLLDYRASMLDIDKNLLSGYFNLTEKLMYK